MLSKSWRSGRVNDSSWCASSFHGNPPYNLASCFAIYLKQLLLLLRRLILLLRRCLLMIRVTIIIVSIPWDRSSHRCRCRGCWRTVIQNAHLLHLYPLTISHRLLISSVCVCHRIADSKSCIWRCQFVNEATIFTQLLLHLQKFLMRLWRTQSLIFLHGCLRYLTSLNIQAFAIIFP